LKRLVVGGIGAALLAGFLLASVEVPGHHRNARAGIPARLPDGTPSAVHKIRHVVLIMQENRSFDSYFGTYPGADGIPGLAGNPGKVPCVPDPKLHRCVRPYHDVADRNFGGPHNYRAGIADLAGGGMTGFIKSARTGLKNVCAKHLNNPACSLAPKNPDVMGYHDWREIPNYWDYAHHFVLQDHLFESDLSWSLPDHLSLVSGWSAKCRKDGDPMSCHSSTNARGPLPESPYRPGDGSDYAWTDLTYLLHRYGVSWGYYVANGSQPDCANGAMLCASVPQRTRTPGIWNPLPYFDTVRQDGQLGNIQPLQSFLTAARSGTLPNVSWIAPNQKFSEHPPSLVTAGQSYVTSLIDAIMRGPNWDSTAIFLCWDDWGGFYDHVRPRKVDAQGYGLRVPGLVISAYARKGYIDHQTLSQDAYLKFIEDDFLHGARIDPRTDGRPDPRPDVRENAPILGNLANDFDFNQKPRPPRILPLHPHTADKLRTQRLVEPGV
jgi:phospholipase C